MTNITEQEHYQLCLITGHYVVGTRGQCSPGTVLDSASTSRSYVVETLSAEKSHPFENQN